MNFLVSPENNSLARKKKNKSERLRRKVRTLFPESSDLDIKRGVDPLGRKKKKICTFCVSAYRPHIMKIWTGFNINM